jgi:hypothetical protein
MAGIPAPDEREVKLPVWVQDTINTLRRELRDRDATIATLQWQNPQTDMFLTRSRQQGSLPLPKGESIRWRMSDGRWIEIRKKQEPLSSDLLSGKAYLSVYSDAQLLVVPHVTNVVNIFTL